MSLHAHSYFSFGGGVLSPEDICRTARAQGEPVVGLTDTGNLYGLVRFLTAARREGLKPVAGAVLRDGQGRELATAYVLDRRGFARLAGLLSRWPGEPPGDRAAGAAASPRAELLERGWEGLALLCSDGGLLAELAAAAGRFAGLDGRGRLYARLVYGRPFRSLVRTAADLGVPLCAVNDAWYTEEAGAALGNLLSAMHRLCRLEDLPPGARLAPWQRWAGRGEMERFFSAVPEALEGARELAERADTRGILAERFVFPAFEGLSEDEAFRRLRSACERGIARRYGEQAGAGCGGGGPARARARLDYELNIIRAKGFAAYFLVVADIVAQCPRTCGRGSAAASIVAYLLGITHVDPLRYNLFFERFLNMERKDPPDIDVDFPWDEREKALRYVFARYPGRSAMVADHVTFGPRSSLREPAKALGLPEEEIARLVAFWRHGRLELIPAYLRRAAERIRGFPRYLGTHPGGVVITPGPITDYTQVQESPLGYPVIAWEKDAAEEAGLVKIDLLGNRSLAVLRDTLALVNRTRGAGLTWEGREALEDGETRALIASGRTLGIFYVESPATRQLLQKMRAGDYERLVIASSIIRPAANRWIREFVRRLHGAPYRPLAPQLEKTLEETCGIMVYQEDVSRVVIDAAGFSAGDADQLRKILSKKDRELRLPDFRARFFRGGAQRGVPRRDLEQIWQMIMSFEGYSFCKAHSASYALVSYKLAHLKRLFPLEFFTSVINNGGGFYSRQTYLNEVRRLGFPILPPDVNSSRLDYTVEGGALRVGLGQLRDLPLEFLQRLLEDRGRRGPFAGFRDLLARLAPGLPEVRVLVRSGSLDGLAGGLTRPELLWQYFRETKRPGRRSPPGYRRPPSRGHGSAPAPARPGVGPGLELPLPPPGPAAQPRVLPGIAGVSPPAAIGDYPPEVKLRDELDTLGLMISRHPLGLFGPRIRRLAADLPKLIDSRALPAHRGRRVTLAGLLVTGKEVLTGRREPMVFVSFEDEHSVFETVFFPKAFREFYPLLDGGGVFLVSGRVEEEQGAVSLHAERLLGLERAAGAAEAAFPAPSPRNADGRAPSPLAAGRIWGFAPASPAEAEADAEAT
jgi:DNA polymerase III alpha subunit